MNNEKQIKSAEAILEATIDSEQSIESIIVAMERYHAQFTPDIKQEITPPELWLQQRDYSNSIISHPNAGDQYVASVSDAMREYAECVASSIRTHTAISSLENKPLTPDIEGVEEAAEKEYPYTDNESLQFATRQHINEHQNSRRHGAKFGAQWKASKQAAQPQDNWIKVSNGTPEHMVKVWAYIESIDKYCEAIYYRNVKCWRKDKTGQIDLPVTHWQPLPTPPTH